ncbi:maleate cis-trans isomerase family protein [Paracoccus sp. (in: a-proteobacteria)]|uniref:maleate cis-trans isomerase family protein n=1 Tax=Paracoccus sp. TaxID=267 RepID=UPI00272D805F|nr:aspartate/glutamate racemase family protein [Paracoccus sp. (in: a-proteobacteria)]
MKDHMTLSGSVPDIRLGMLTPSSNSALEPLTQALLTPVADRVSAHFARFRVTQIALGDASDLQFRQEPILAAAELLADARPAVIAWNGTSASWLGFDRDEALCAEITGRTGLPATSAILELNLWLKQRGIRRLGLVTPYTADVQARIIANYARIGIEIVTETHAGLTDNFAFSTLPEEQIARMCRDVAAGVEALAIVCTNMRGAMVASAVEAQTGVPVLDSVAVTLWGCLTRLGIPTGPLAQFGSVFTLPRPQPA